MLTCDCAVCSSADPKDRRLRSSLYIEEEQTKLVIDCGPDFRQQLLDLGEWNLDAVLLTHEHNDHVAGLDELRSIHQSQKRNFPLYLNAQTEASIRERFAYAFQNKHAGVPKFELNRVESGDCFRINTIDIEALEIDHGFIKILGYKIGDLTYITDAKIIPSSTMKRIVNSPILVINALRQSPHKTHFSLQEALDLVKVVKPKKAFITHMSHRIGLHEDVQKQLPNNTFLSYDGLELTV